MCNKKVLCSSTYKASLKPSIHFIAALDFNNVNFFNPITATNSSYDFSYLEVYINDALTSQAANSISAQENDDIRISSTTDFYPRFGAYMDLWTLQGIDYIKSIVDPLPLMYEANNTPSTSLTSIFDTCTRLETIPEGLFDNNPQVTNFSNAFYSCSSLSSTPLNLFDKHKSLFNLYCCFWGCSNLKVNVQIGSTHNEALVTNFAARTKERGIVYCRANSAMYNAFAAADVGVDVLTY